jgi:hypothetical protein
MTRKKDGRKTKQFALKASVNNINHWNNMTDAERKARVDKMQAGRRRKQAEKEQANREAYTYDPIREWVQSTLKTGPYAPKKPRPLDIAKTNMTPVPPTHETPDLDLGDIMMPDFAEQEKRNRAKAAFDKVSVARASRVLVNGIKEVALREDDIEITADEEYVGISWQKLQSLVYQMMKEMDNE